MHILFVNSCIRGEQSRTLRLCRTALDEMQKTLPDVTVEELCLDKEEVLPLNSKRLMERHELEEKEEFNNPMFRYAKQFAAADVILVGVPYWEYQFPAMFRCYLEQVSVCGVTFAYTEDGRPKGLCQADRLLYVTTSGGPILHRNCGFDYVKTLCGDMLGIANMEFAAAEGLDVWGTDVEAKLAETEETLRTMIRSWK